MGILYYEYLLISTCEKTNFVHTIPLQNRQTQTISDVLLHRVCFLTGPPTKLSNRSGFSTNITSHQRTADKPGMYNANNQSMEITAVQKPKDKSRQLVI